MILFFKSEVFPHRNIGVLLYHFIIIYWYFSFHCVIHSVEVVVKYHILLGGGGGGFWFSCLMLVLLSLHEMVIVPVISLPFPLVNTWLVMAYLPVGDPLAQIWGKPRCVSLLGRFINLHRITSFMYFPCTFPYQGWCTYESMI